VALKVGGEDKKKVAIAGVLGAIVLFLVIKTLWSTFAPSPAPAPAPAPVVQTAPEPAAAPAAASRNLPHAATRVGGSAAGAEMARLDPTLHPEWMVQAESLEYTGKGRNIFSMSSYQPAIEAVQGPIRPSKPGPAVAMGPPPPPPIDLKFFGFEAGRAGARKAFLLHGDDVFIAAAGDVVDHRYKVVRIDPFNLQVEDIPYHNTQTLPLVQN
jgi:hypothetical protein